MRTSALEQYVKWKQELTKQRKNLITEVERIDAVLNSTTTSNGHVRSESPAPPRQRRTNQKNQLTLKAAIAQAVRKRPLDKKEILEAIGQIGYKFITRDPMGSINALLYSPAGKTAFRNQGGKFSVK